ncbi:MAG: MltA domain-containing protein [Pseudomonadota bacterium]
MQRPILYVTLFALAACGGESEAVAPYTPLSDALLGDIPGTEVLDALPAFLSTCPRLLSGATEQTVPEDWADICATAEAVTSPNAASAWLKEHFAVLKMETGEALITGYFEPVFEASAEQDLIHTAPVLSRPGDLVMVDLGAFRDELKGQRIAGRVHNGRLVPYADRTAVIASMPSEDDVIAWMHPDDLFFLQIQGSGILDIDGTFQAVGYAAQNGHKYHAIGRTLVEEGYLALEEVTMQSIRDWLNDAPTEEAARVRQTNPSYVYFTDRGPANQQGPIGSAGVPLTENVSIAVDPLWVPLGAPVWITGQGLHIAQDTGGAIKGSGRADLFVGRGDEAGEIAGALKLETTMTLLLPRSAAARLLAQTSS